jgi:hypothetical protein
MQDTQDVSNNDDSLQKDKLRSIVNDVISEFVESQKKTVEPAYKAELVEERKRRESLERRVNELVKENERSRKMAEEADRHSKIKGELQKMGVAKVDLAFRAIRDDVRRSDDGALFVVSNEQPVGLTDFVKQFVNENPEFLPARIPGGSGTSPAASAGQRSAGRISLEQIRPGMDPEELQRVRQQIAEAAAESFLKY